jgi:hypothetical protein
MTTASSVRPSVNVASRRPAPWTTWSFVTTYPSGAMITPEPAPPGPTCPPDLLRPTLTLTTAGPTAATAETTARE